MVHAAHARVCTHINRRMTKTYLTWKIYLHAVKLVRINQNIEL